MPSCHLPCYALLCPAIPCYALLPARRPRPRPWPSSDRSSQVVGPPDGLGWAAGPLGLGQADTSGLQLESGAGLRQSLSALLVCSPLLPELVHPSNLRCRSSPTRTAPQNSGKVAACQSWRRRSGLSATPAASPSCTAGCTGSGFCEGKTR